MIRRTLCAFALGLSIGAAQATDPTMSVIASTVDSLSFEAYSGMAPVGVGQVSTDVVYFIDEQTGALGKSWYLFYEPTKGQTFTATFTFDSAISGLLYTTSDLDATNATYGAPGFTYQHADFTGLEDGDTFSIAGNVLSLHLRALNPGDHLRVFTVPVSAVPEPATYLLLTVALAAMGLLVRRRKR